jgi:hypothetical protein
VSVGNCFTVAGLILDVIGATILVWPLYTSTEDDVRKATADLWDGNPLTTREALRTRKFARWGFPLLICGFLLQIAGVFTT